MYYINQRTPPHLYISLRSAPQYDVGRTCGVCTTCPYHTPEAVRSSGKPLGRTSYIHRPQRPHLHEVCIYVPLTDFSTFLSQKALPSGTPWPNGAGSCCFRGRAGWYSENFYQFAYV